MSLKRLKGSCPLKDDPIYLGERIILTTAEYFWISWIFFGYLISGLRRLSEYFYMHKISRSSTYFWEGYVVDLDQLHQFQDTGPLILMFMWEAEPFAMSL